MSVSEKATVLLALHQHHEQQSRHHDDQNTKVVSLVLVLTSAVLGLVGWDDAITAADVWLGLFLLLIGCYGAVFSTKHYERHYRKKLTAHRLRDAIEEIYKDELPLAQLRTVAEADHLKRFPRWLFRLHLYHAWIAVHLLVVAFGVGITIVASQAS